MNNESFLAHIGHLFLIDNILKLKDICRFSLGVYIFKNRDSIDFNRQQGYFTRGRRLLLSNYQQLSTALQSVFLPPHHHGILFLKQFEILQRFLSSSVVSKVFFATVTCSLDIVDYKCKCKHASTSLICYVICILSSSSINF